MFAELGLEHAGFAGDVEAYQEPGEFGLEAALSCHTDFCRRRGCRTFDAAQNDPVGAEMFEVDIGDDCRDIRIEIPWSLDLVEQLCSTGLDTDDSLFSFLLRDDHFTIAADFRNWEPKIVPALTFKF